VKRALRCMVSRARPTTGWQIAAGFASSRPGQTGNEQAVWERAQQRRLRALLQKAYRKILALGRPPGPQWLG
jgi:hypothetical protein